MTAHDPGRAPLADLTVIAVEQYGAGPWASMQLADLGARVIKVEDPLVGGDVGRSIPPYQKQGSSLFFESFNRGKQSVMLDLRDAAGREAFEDLVETADAVLFNLRGDAPAKLRLTYEDLRHRNERIVCCSLSGFGRTGPRAAQPAYDYVLQAMAGWMSLTGEPTGPPTKTGLSLVDFSGGYVAALSLLAAVWRARRDGVGADCDVSLHESALSLLNYVGTWAAAGHVTGRTRHSAHPSVVPFQAFEVRDGWITVACAKQQFWERLCRAIDLPGLLEDQRYRDFSGRAEHRESLLAALAARFLEQDGATWESTLIDAGVPVGRVRGLDTAFDDPQVVARNGVASYEHPVLGTVRQPVSPMRISGYDAPVRRAPGLGEDTEDVLREHDWSAERIAEARSAGAFGTAAEQHESDGLVDGRAGNE